MMSSRKYYQKNKDNIIERNNANTKYSIMKIKPQFFKKLQKCRQQRKCKVSLIDNLPCDVQYKVYSMKHQLEFSPSLNYIEKQILLLTQ